MSSPVIRWLLLLALVVLVFYIIFCNPQRQTLAIYQLAQPNVSTTSPPIQLGSLLGPGGVTVSETTDRVYFRAGPRRVEVYKSSGGFWYEDSTRLWNPDSVPQHLPDSSQLRPATIAFSTHGKRATIPFSADTGFTKFEFKRILPTLVKTLDTAGTSTTVTLDWQVGYGAVVAERQGANKNKYPVTGGGGDFKIDVGDSGAVIGFHGVWREIRGVARRERLVRRQDADRQYRQQVGANVVFPEPTIAYYSAPAPLAQSELYPVYVYSGKKVIGGDSISLGVVMVPATRAGNSTVSTGSVPPQQRSPGEQPRPGSMDPEGPEEGGNGPPATNPWREVAASWIGTSQGVPNAEANAGGFLNALTDDGWAVNFNRGDADAYHSDWSVNRDRWADAADMIFYTGHASAAGWTLVDSAQSTVGSLQYRTLTSLDGAFGAQDLEWIVISACGPLQDNTISAGGGNAILRWRGAFSGLHILLGFGSATFDYAEEGRRFAQYALEGRTIVNAWFRAAVETQPATNGFNPPDGPSIYVGAMWARRWGGSGVRPPFNDHLWGHGNVAPDPKPPTAWSIIWVPT